MIWWPPVITSSIIRLKEGNAVGENRALGYRGTSTKTEYFKGMKSRSLMCHVSCNVTWTWTSCLNPFLIWIVSHIIKIFTNWGKNWDTTVQSRWGSFHKAETSSRSCLHRGQIYRDNINIKRIMDRCSNCNRCDDLTHVWFRAGDLN